MQRQPTFKDSDKAFDEAIEAGRLSADPASLRFAGHYMYMGTYGQTDQFKHIDTREYLASGTNQ